MYAWIDLKHKINVRKSSNKIKLMKWRLDFKMRGSRYQRNIQTQKTKMIFSRPSQKGKEKKAKRETVIHRNFKRNYNRFG